MNRRHLISSATLAATLALPAAAGAQDAPPKDCLKFDSKDKSALTYTFTGNTLTLTPRSDDEFLRVKTSKRKTVKVTRVGDSDVYTFDLPKVEGETFEATKRKSGTGKLNLRVNVLEADGDKLTRFNVKVKAYDEVVCKKDEPKSDDEKKPGDDKSRGRGRGPESEEIRKSRVERGEGRGPETDAERDARKDDDR